MASYYEIEKTGEGQYREKMSRFLAFAVRTDSVEDAKEIIKRYQNEYCDSRHVCWAYMLGADMAEWQLNDNGEPSGTAGKPILGQIRSHGVTNVVVVVVRYFGGIKLGTSGLITAYKEAACLALDDAGKKEMHEMSELSLSVSYATVDGVMRLAKEDPDVEILESEFDNLCRLKLRFPLDKIDYMKGKLSGIEGLTIN